MASNGDCDSRIVQLARTISTCVTKINEALLENGLPSPSFDENTPVAHLPPGISEYQDTVLDATAELHDLLLEPLHLIQKNIGVNDPVCLQAISRYGIANLIPLGGRASFAELAKHTGLGEQMITRLLRHAMTMRVFCEPEPGQVAHTQASRFIATTQMSSLLRVATQIMWPAATKMLDALEKWPGSQEPNETGFGLSKESTQCIYDFMGSTPEESADIAGAMEILVSRPEYSTLHVANGYDWAALLGTLSGSESDRKRIRIVDVGGAKGHVAFALAQAFPRIEVVVQDMDKMVEGAEAGLPKDLKNDGRVQFMAHDLFAPQTTPADVYLLRSVLHNWSDKYCIAILRAHIAVLGPGARLIVMEIIMPEPGENTKGVGALPLWVERDLRCEDLHMGAVFNAQERTLSEWKALFIKADSRFVLKSVNRPKGSIMSLMELELTP